MTPQWASHGLTATLADEWDPASPVRVLTLRSARPLDPEHARSLAWWLLAHVGDRQAPADPDRVRVAVDEARAELRRRSAAAETSEDFRAGLAWCEHHLDAIARAAS